MLKKYVFLISSLSLMHAMEKESLLSRALFATELIIAARCKTESIDAVFNNIKQLIPEEVYELLLKKNNQLLKIDGKLLPSEIQFIENSHLALQNHSDVRIHTSEQFPEFITIHSYTENSDNSFTFHVNIYKSNNFSSIKNVSVKTQSKFSLLNQSYVLDNNTVLISTAEEIRSINMATNETVWIVKYKGYDFHIAAYNDKHQYLIFLNRNGEIWKLQLNTGELEKIFSDSKFSIAANHSSRYQLLLSSQGTYGVLCIQNKRTKLFYFKIDKPILFEETIDHSNVCIIGVNDSGILTYLEKKAVGKEMSLVFNNIEKKINISHSLFSKYCEVIASFWINHLFVLITRNPYMPQKTKLISYDTEKNKLLDNETFDAHIIHTATINDHKKDLLLIAKNGSIYHWTIGIVNNATLIFKPSAEAFNTYLKGSLIPIIEGCTQTLDYGNKITDEIITLSFNSQAIVRAIYTYLMYKTNDLHILSESEIGTLLEPMLKNVLQKHRDVLPEFKTLSIKEENNGN